MRKIILATMAVAALAVLFLSCGGRSPNSFVPPPPGNSTAVAFLQQKPNSPWLFYPVLGKFSGSQFTTSMVKDPSTGEYVSAMIGAIFLSAKGDQAALQIYGGTDNATPNDHWDIYVGTVDGANLVQITNDENQNYLPQFNPAATKVIFSSYRPVGDGYTWFTVIRNTDGTGEQVLPNPANSWGTWHPSYSPDGSKIAVEAWGMNDQGNVFDGIFLINPDGSNAKMLTNPFASNCWCQDEEPSFTSDGRQIVFSRETFDMSTGTLVNEDVYIMKADGTAVTKLTNGIGINFDPTVVYDSTLQADRVLFSSNRDQLSAGSDGFELYSISPTGANMTALTNNNVYDAFNAERYEPTELSATARVRHAPRTPAMVQHRLHW